MNKQLETKIESAAFITMYHKDQMERELYK